MSRKRRRRVDTAAGLEARLDAVYAQLPEIACKGKCWDGCTNIRLADVERDRIERKHGVHIADTHPATHGLLICPALTTLKQCGVYPDRPFICRVWGLIRALRCDHGCVPEGGFVNERDAWLLLAEVHDIGGDRAEAASLRAVFTGPHAEAAERLMRGLDPRVDPYRMAARSRAEAAGAVYVSGPGRLSSTPPH